MNREWADAIDHDEPRGHDLAREVLAPDEMAEYAAAQRLKPRSKTDRGPQRLRIDDLGYDQWGHWHPEAEQA